MRGSGRAMPGEMRGSGGAMRGSGRAMAGSGEAGTQPTRPGARTSASSTPRPAARGECAAVRRRLCGWCDDTSGTVAAERRSAPECWRQCEAEHAIDLGQACPSEQAGLPGAEGSEARPVQMCCTAITAQCLACSKGISVYEFCKANPGNHDCDEQAIHCPSPTDVCAGKPKCAADCPCPKCAPTSATSEATPESLPLRFELAPPSLTLPPLPALPTQPAIDTVPADTVELSMVRSGQGEQATHALVASGLRAEGKLDDAADVAEDGNGFTIALIVTACVLVCATVAAAIAVTVLKRRQKKTAMPRSTPSMSVPVAVTVDAPTGRVYAPEIMKADLV